MKTKNRQENSSLLERIRFYFEILGASSPAYFFIADVDAKVTMLSKNWATDFGLRETIVHDVGDGWLPFLHPTDVPRFKEELDAILVRGEKDELNHAYRAKNRYGEYVWLKARGKVQRSAGGKPRFFGGVINRMDRLNQADKVTGLLNKTQFEKEVKAALDEFHRTGVGGQITILGLDNFKILNESYNRSFGDAVLRTTAQQIVNILPGDVTLYKLDGDEFGFVQRGAGNVQVDRVFKAVQTCMSRQQFIDGKMYFCTVSGGTVAYPQGGKEYLTLYKHAEAALALAKRDGKNQNIVFTHEQYNRWMRSMSIRDTIKTSVENNCEGFSLFYQPQVDAHTKRIIGAEALLRWKGPEGRMVSPMEFVPILEETKMILPLGKWIVEEALKTCKSWRRFIPDFEMSINVSYAQIKDVTFFPFVRDVIERIGVPPQAVTLELTESTIVSDWTFLNQQFDEFREQGVQIAMDDFGTGYSSLAYLKKLSCDIVKVDREFVKHILDNDFDRRLVEFTVTLCHSVGIRSCIEGVEENAVYELVKNRCGADYIQGYLFGRPVAEADFVKSYLEAEAHGA